MSAEAKSSGWSVSAEYGWRWGCLLLAPLNFSTVVRLWVPLTHSVGVRM